MIGKVFWPAALGAVSAGTNDVDQQLHALERKEFLRRDRQSIVAGETQWAFLHALVRDVAYGQIPRSQRADRHLRTAAWIESLAPDRTEDRADMLAHHYGEALALASVAGIDTAPFRDSARQAFVEASERAGALNSWDQAQRFAMDALELCVTEDPSRAELLLTVARASSNQGTFDMDVAREARDAFVGAGALERAAETEVLLSWMSFHRSDGAGRLAHARQAVELVRSRPLSRAKARALAQLARTLYLGGERNEALEEARRALAMARELDDDEIASHALNTLGMCRVQLGDAAGLDDLRASIVHGERANSPDAIVSGWNNLLNQCLMVGRLEEGAECLHSGLKAGRRYGHVQSLRWFTAEAMFVHDLRGDLGEALATVDGFLAQPENEGLYQAAGCLEIRAKILLARGQTEEAFAESERALAQAREVGDPQVLGPALCSRARVLAAGGRRSEAQQLLDELLGERRITDEMVPDLSLTLADLGRAADYEASVAGGPPDTTLWRRAGLAVSRGDLAGAASIYEGMGARFCEAWAHLLAAEAGDTKQVERARRYFDEQGAAAFARRCDAVLPASA